MFAAKPLWALTWYRVVQLPTLTSSGALRVASSVESDGATCIVLTLTGCPSPPPARAVSAAATALAVAFTSSARPRREA